MATLAPSNRVRTTLSAAEINSEQLAVALRPWRRRLLLQQVATWMGRGIIVGLMLASFLLGISRLVPWATAFDWALNAGIACVLLALGFALWYRPSLVRTARLVDTRLALRDRLSTAWEMRNEIAPLYNLQRRDALKQLSKHTPGTAISLRPSRASLLIFAVFAVLLALLLLLPNPMMAVLQQQAAFQTRIARQVASIDRVRTEIAQQTSTSVQRRAQFDQILRNLENKLHEAKNETQAQQAIAEAQAQLAALRDPQANNKAQARAAASSSLQGSPDATLSAVGQALATNDSKKLAQALKNLADQVSKMTPAQRAKLAQQIENAANQAQQNPDIQASLHQLAKSIADGSASEISDASNSMEVAASQDANTQAQAHSIDKVMQSLQAAANTIAAATDGSNTSDQEQGQGKGQQGQGQGQGQGNGQGQGQGSGGNGSGGHGSGGGKGGVTGGKAGQNEQVYVPGQIGAGTSTQSNDGNNSVVQNGSSVPYSQVIKEYNQMAHDAIDNSNIAPDLKDLVHGYFDALAGK